MRKKSNRLYNISQQGHKEGKERVTIYIDYEEFDQASYRTVEVHFSSTGEVKVFSNQSKDVIVDWNNALDYVRSNENIGEYVYSSSVDSFLMDGKNYAYDKNNNIVRVLHQMMLW